MHRILAILLCIRIALVGANGARMKPTVSIDEDAMELAQLAEEFWSLKPAVFENQGPLVLCQFIDQYCTLETRLQAISVMLSSIAKEYRSKNRYAKVLNTCLNSTALQETKRSSPLLRRLIYPTVTSQDQFEILEHQRVIGNYFDELNDLTNSIYTSCNNEEMHALLCLSNAPLLTTCARKILQRTYDDADDDTYQAVTRKIKATLTDLNQQLSRHTAKTD